MSEVTVTVRGEHEARVAPERATIRVSVRAEGSERTTVVEHVMRLGRARTRQHHGAGRGGQRRRLDQQTTLRASRATLEQRRQAPRTRLLREHRLHCDIRRGIGTLDMGLGHLALGRRRGGLGRLAPHPRDTNADRAGGGRRGPSASPSPAPRHMRGLSVLDEVTPLEIADVGLISSGQPMPGAPMMKARGGVAFAADAAPAMEYEPEEIVISSRRSRRASSPGEPGQLMTVKGASSAARRSDTLACTAVPASRCSTSRSIPVSWMAATRSPRSYGITA